MLGPGEPFYLRGGTNLWCSAWMTPCIDVGWSGSLTPARVAPVSEGSINVADFERVAAEKLDAGRSGTSPAGPATS